mgnify:CR=1 FL=1
MKNIYKKCTIVFLILILEINMEKIELCKVYAYAELLWNTFKRETDELKSQLQNRLWWDFLKNYDLEVIYAGMRELAKEENFCSIAKVAKECQKIMKIAKNEVLDEDLIFSEINSAISYYNAQENFDKLSDIAKSVVVNPSQLSQWATSEITEFNTVIASNIKKSIRNKIQFQEKCESVDFKKILQLSINNPKQIEDKK